MRKVTHSPHGTPSFRAFPTYKLGCDRRHIPMVSMISSTSCQSTLSSSSPWHTADGIDFLFSGHLLMLLVSSAQLPTFSRIAWFSAQKPRLAQKQQHKQQQQQQQQAKQQTIAKPFQNGWALTGCNFNEVRTRCEGGANEVRTRSEIKFWETDPLSLLTNSLVATRFRILFRTVKLKSFQR